ncbi:MAG TPA: tetraacyldisaccharide 4'-kinase [Candidatus Hydrogenedentes bacterium]|nr:tetraacyldisaccharide 4'-kinase [Candidatus Hydrogenedentota bacterium]HQH51689.1 tetraacyldisaccharide 4'-kinase [Candidatus Hydrogenedentota bacterium]HQM50476.1 tetraacyldisaccharide 4'-kinase [Candidatus Hydrogenedentota bacterium]
MSAWIQSIADKIRRGEPVPLPLAALLSLATPVMRAGMRMRLRRPRVRVDARVISLGNITAGGTGKTPAVIERAWKEIGAGHRVAVLTRGYGARSEEPMAVHVGKGSPALCASLGDEPALIATRVPEALIVRCADRVAAARKAIGEYDCDTLILDDGYQYVQLERDENVLVIDATNPFGNGRLIPRGILREPLEAMARATHIILTRCDQADSFESILDAAAAYCPEAPIRRTRHVPSVLWRVSNGEQLPLTRLAEEKVCAVCGIGNPEAFFNTLEELGTEITCRMAYPDHSPFPVETLPRDMLVVTTEKDAMRLEEPGTNIVALGIELEDIV